MRGRLILAVFSCWLLSACLLLTDLSGLTSADGPAPGADASDAEAGGQPGHDDAASGSDAARDAGFCAAHPGHGFCEDFDEPGFDTRMATTIPNGAFELVGDAGAASTSSLHASLALAAKAGFGPQASTTLVGSHRATTTLALLPAGVTSGYAHAFYMRFKPTTSSLKLVTAYLRQLPGKQCDALLEIIPLDGGTSYPSMTAVPCPGWSVVQLDLDADQGKATVTFDGRAVGVITFAPFSFVSANLVLGVPYGSFADATGGSAETFTDDVLFDVADGR
jgi:hypothetical protein